MNPTDLSNCLELKVDWTSISNLLGEHVIDFWSVTGVF